MALEVFVLADSSSRHGFSPSRHLLPAWWGQMLPNYTPSDGRVGALGGPTVQMAWLLVQGVHPLREPESKINQCMKVFPKT